MMANSLSGTEQNTVFKNRHQRFKTDAEELDSKCEDILDTLTNLTYIFYKHSQEINDKNL